MYCVSYIQMQFVLTLGWNYAHILSIFFLRERFVFQQIISRIYWTGNLLRTNKRYRKGRSYAGGSKVSSLKQKKKSPCSQHYPWKFPPSFIKSTLIRSNPVCPPPGLEQSIVSCVGSWWSHWGTTIYEELCLQPENHSSKWDVLTGKGK